VQWFWIGATLNMIASPANNVLDRTGGQSWAASGRGAAVLAAAQLGRWVSFLGKLTTAHRGEPNVDASS
jgi:hypothetical protein